MIIKLQGSIPSKKNLLRRSKNGGMFRDAKVAKQINDLTIQAKAQWMGREPLHQPKTSAMFIILDERADPDNRWTTILDCMVQAGILINDNFKHGPKPQIVDWRKSQTGEEGVLIDIEENA
jgi:hypothetical protein